jgi:23S rRNA pseudouridine1911/1915/1917 synthase
MLDAVVREQAGVGALSWNKARELITRGKVTVDGVTITEITHRVAPSNTVVVDVHARRLRRAELPDDSILYVDADVVVVRKPAGMMTVPYEDERDTLVDRTRIALIRHARERAAKHKNARTGSPAQQELGVVQRLDKDTTGVLVFARTLDSKRVLAQQLRVHSVERRYLAIVNGSLSANAYPNGTITIESDLIRDRGDGLKGSFGIFRRPRGPLPDDAQHAITHIRPLEALRSATLVECKLETGRQHQIRIHLSERGHPIAGEQVYIRDYKGERVAAERPMLHAAVLGFDHPRTGKPMRFSLEPPDDFKALLEKLRAR